MLRALGSRTFSVLARATLIPPNISGRPCWASSLTAALSGGLAAM